MGVTLLGKGKDPHQTKHCPLRLISIPSSDAFAESFSVTGDSAERNAIDTDKASNNRGFWIDVQAAVVAKEKNEACNESFFDSNKCRADTVFNPRSMEQQSWEKPQSVWKEVNERHKEADWQLTQSDTHKSGFFNFCNGQKDICCLCQH